MNQSCWTFITLTCGLILTAASAAATDPPCDKYPPAQQLRCTEIWKALNKEDGPTIAQFGLDQQKRREEGKINAQQHLAENMTFIKQSTEKRIERLSERMARE
jgi:mannose/cellobiose epimerase-like protein (N-acyl-D-glucosamine 2-epimerase family)